MTNLIAFDTNIYFYALDNTIATKHAIANALIRDVSDDQSLIILQVMGELANAITRRRPDLVPGAQNLIGRLARVGVPTWSADILLALDLHKQNGMQFWDAVIWAAARRNGCTVLFSEDYQHARKIGGVTYYNPFQLSQAELTDLLA